MADETKQNLDGKTPVRPVPFDAHDRRVRDVEPPAEPQEYPKAVDHVEHPSGVGLQPVLVNNEEEEAAHEEAKAAAAKKAEAEKAEETKQS